ncbi:glycosyltransferase [Ectopseudomonas oleovorans]|uniref:glycosyltransferase n=1 Tax=Ectopseudomonas oleovorans TaxID=301 RepID=UPI0019CF5665|nr:glycosyltransferase [Pseudomonas oleovorans]
MPDQDISKQFDKLRNAFRKELRESVNDIRLDALYQQLLMQHVFKQPEPLAAMTTWSIAPEFAWWLYQYVTTARPEKIIELGSGTSTLVIAAALKQLGKGNFLSFEHDHAYYEKTRVLLQACDLQNHVELLYAPLEKLELAGDSYRWYDLPYDLIDHMIGRESLDLLLIDGPPAATNRHARYPAMLRLRDYCNDSTAVLLDDAGREEEQEILARWIELSGGKGTYQLLSNIRHGPALFYPSKQTVSLNICEDISMESVSELVGQEVEQLVERALSELPQDKNGELAKPLLDAFYRLRERSLHELKIKYSAVNGLCQALEKQVLSLQTELADAVVVGKQRLAERTALQDQLDKLTADRQQMSAQIEALEADLTAARDAQAALEQGTAERQNQIATLETQRDEQLGVIEGLKGELVDALARVERAEHALEQGGSEWQASIAALQAERDEQLGVIEGLKGELVDALARVERAEHALEQGGSEWQASIAALQAERDEQLGVIEALKGELADMQGRIERADLRENLTLEELQKLQEKLDASAVELDEAQAREFDLELRLQRVEAREVALLEELEAMEQRIGMRVQAATEFTVTSMQAQLDSAKRANEKLMRLAESAKKELDVAILDRNALKTELTALGKRYKLVYKSLVYQLGMAFYRQTRNVMSWAKMPLAIHRVMRRHAASGNPELVEYQEPVMPRLRLLAEAKAIGQAPLVKAFDVAACSEALKKTVKGVKNNTVLWVASQIADEQGYQAALQFAEENVHEMQRLGLNLLRANANLHSEKNWLSYFNAYLKPFDLAPVSLSAVGGTRFSRLRVAEPLAPVQGPLISVIMPAFNAEATLRHAAQSILEQTWRNLQLIIVDDCSSDATWEIAQQIAGQDSRVLALRNAANVGPYVSKNLALRLAKGEYITGQDADDWSHPQRLERDIEPILTSNGQLLAVLSGMVRMNSEGEFCRFAKVGTSSADGVRRVASISLLIEAKYLRDVLGGWDSVRFGADSELIIRAEKIMGEQFERLDHIGMFCLDLDTSLTNDPVFGVSKVSGISPVRKEFRDAYMKWHLSIDKKTARLPFPHVDRRFKAPKAMLVPLEYVQRNIDFHDFI